MAIDNSSDWWVGSEPSDIESFLTSYTQTEAVYPTNAFRQVNCQCSSNRFRLARASSVAERICVACGQVRFISRSPDGKADDWAEAIQEEEPECYQCIGCAGNEANVGVGFAGYAENAELDAIKWFYVGVRCATCDILGCFNEGKVGRGPAAAIYPQVVGE